MNPLVLMLLLVPTAQTATRTVTIQEALASTRANSRTLKSVSEFLVQADEVKSIGIGMFLPKLQAEGQWMHMGERHLPDISVVDTLSAFVGDLTSVVLEEHPNQAARFLPYQGLMEGGVDLSAIESIVPEQNTLSGTFSIIVPVFNAESIPFVQGAYDQYDVAVQRVGHAREQLLFGVAKAYYGLCTLQAMIEVVDRSIESAKEHHKSSQIRAELATTTELEVKRAQLEVMTNESKKIELSTQLEKVKATFRYLTGIEGEFVVVEPQLTAPLFGSPADTWQEEAMRQRKDLAATQVEVLVAEHEVDKILAKYLPNLNLVLQGKADTAQEQRFDDDPFSWYVIATLGLNVWDGGIRESQVNIAESQLRQKELAHQDLTEKVKSEVSSAHRALEDASTARKVAESQSSVARSAQELAKAAEEAGVATYLEVIDANTMVAASDANFIAKRLEESIVLLDLLSAAGSPIPWSPPDRSGARP